jgi:hypothetical protein
MEVERKGIVIIELDSSQPEDEAPRIGRANEPERRPNPVFITIDDSDDEATKSDHQKPPETTSTTARKATSSSSNNNNNSRLNSPAHSKPSSPSKRSATNQAATTTTTTANNATKTAKVAEDIPSSSPQCTESDVSDFSGLNVTDLPRAPPLPISRSHGVAGQGKGATTNTAPSSLAKPKAKLFQPGLPPIKPVKKVAPVIPEQPSPKSVVKPKEKSNSTLPLLTPPSTTASNSPIRVPVMSEKLGLSSIGKPKKHLVKLSSSDSFKKQRPPKPVIDSAIPSNPFANYKSSNNNNINNNSSSSNNNGPQSSALGTGRPKEVAPRLHVPIPVGKSVVVEQAVLPKFTRPPIIQPTRVPFSSPHHALSPLRTPSSPSAMPSPDRDAAHSPIRLPIAAHVRGSESPTSPPTDQGEKK